MNRDMQEFFRRWHAVDQDGSVDAVFVDQNEIAILKQLNAELRDRLDDQTLRERFARNVGLLRELSAEIRGRVARVRPQLVEQVAEDRPTSHRLDSVFEALHL